MKELAELEETASSARKSSGGAAVHIQDAHASFELEKTFSWKSAINPMHLIRPVSQQSEIAGDDSRRNWCSCFTRFFINFGSLIFPRKIFLPDDPKLRRWDLLVYAVLMFSSLYIPLDCALFTKERIENQISVAAGWVLYSISTFVQFIFVMDTYINFFRAVYRNRVLIYTPGRVRVLYLRTWFTIDLLSCFPAVHLIRFTDNASSGSSPLMLLGLLRLLRLARIQRIVRFRNLPYGSPAVILLIYFFGLCIFCHWGACIWIFMSDMVDQNWVQRFVSNNPDSELNPLERPADLYWAAFYWAAMTVTSIGFGDVLPQHLSEYALCAVMMLLGGLLWASLIGTIVSAVSSTMFRQNKLQKQLDAVDRFFYRRGLKKDPQIKNELKSVRTFLLDRYYKDSLLDSHNEDQDALRLLSHRMRTRIELHLADGILYHVPQFSKLGEMTALYLVQHLRPLAFAKTEVWYE